MYNQGNKVKQHEIDFICKNADKGAKWIAKKLGRNMATVYKFAKLNGADVTKKSKTDAKRRRALIMFNAGLTIQDVVNALDVTCHIASGYYSIYLDYLKEVKHISDSVDRGYWKDESEIEQSFNPYYTYEDLSREEKAMYNGLL